MILQKVYKTVLKPAVAEYEEKKSRFIATVKPVSVEEDAVALISELKTKYWDASHNVYCYHIVGNNTIQRYSDDGEPSGTAGVPILEVMKRTGVQNLVVVVTRYFGGTLLGAAGLIRAYGKSAALGIEAAGIVQKQLCLEISIMMEYTLFGKVQNLLLTRGYTIKDTVFSQDVELIVYIPVGEEEVFEALVVEATNARAVLEKGEKVYITVDMEGKLI
jgi:uncharacterized YigZ family protein